ncbi:MOSC domain-containing protein [Leucobacter soli]|uniref:MOSC domain-containing protein n=1 Tax=Leucobacter soli TaxID=2812850 RepID=A0A916JS27_9MICO|nr:MOSC domain-containing protein [Leucobacter soli]CAG7596414.1 hypothetical protein LEUCIP111803_00086 [Leucobacter soli]
MPHVAALYRYPVKGFTPEPLDELVVQRDGRIAGDRVLAFRFADAATPESLDGLDYWPKSKGLSLQDFPALAALRLSYDEDSRRVRILHGDVELVEAGLDPAGRHDLVETITAYVQDSPWAPRLARPGRLPLELVGDGTSSRFQDRPRGYVTIHGRSSVTELNERLGAPIDDRRFRSNIVVEGFAPRAELGWTGAVRIGGVEFIGEGPIVRCLATHANPDTGERDARVLTALTRDLGLSEPTLGRLLLLSGVGGTIRVGDEVVVDES